MASSDVQGFGVGLYEPVLFSTSEQEMVFGDSVGSITDIRFCADFYTGAV